MSMQTTLEENTSSIALKGGMFTLTTLQLLNTNLSLLSKSLEEKIQQAPNFFKYAPIILDVQRLSDSDSLDLSELLKTLKICQLIPVGIRGASETLKEAATSIGLAIFPEEKVIPKRPGARASGNAAASKPSLSENHMTSSRLITQPVRSGQQIYVPGGDLIVMAPVSNGAEILADGHIHVYSSLRGRALAGVKGNTEARIFCRSLEAELISIAGQYQLSEDLKSTCWKDTAVIQLVDGRLNIRSV